MQFRPAIDFKIYENERGDYFFVFDGLKEIYKVHKEAADVSLLDSIKAICAFAKEDLQTNMAHHGMKALFT